MKHDRLLKVTVTNIIALAFTIVCYSNAAAHPALARKYKTGCTTCHTAFPGLNAVGEAVRINGFKFVDDEIYRKEQPVELGDEAYKKVWPDAVWPSNIPGTVPLSVMVNNKLIVEAGSETDSKFDRQSEFIFPSVVKVLGAGALDNNTSAFLELFWSRGADHGAGHGGMTMTDPDEDSDEALSLFGWIQFEDIIGPENLLNIRVGSVGMHEIGLFTSRDHTRLSISSYLYALHITPVEQMLHAQSGVEVNGAGKHFRHAFGIINGNGENFKDNNSEKDYYTQLTLKFGGLGFDGSGMDEKATKGSPESYKDNSVMLSFFGYLGTHHHSDTGMTGMGMDMEEEIDDEQFWRTTTGIKVRYEDFALGGGFMYGKDDNPNWETEHAEQVYSWFVEAEYYVYPWLVPNVRYESLVFEYMEGSDGDFDEDQARVVANIKAMIRANVTFNIEALIYTQNESRTVDTNPYEIENLDSDNQYSAELSFAF